MKYFKVIERYNLCEMSITFYQGESERYLADAIAQEQDLAFQDGDILDIMAIKEITKEQYEQGLDAQLKALPPVDKYFHVKAHATINGTHEQTYESIEKAYQEDWLLQKLEDIWGDNTLFTNVTFEITETTKEEFDEWLEMLETAEDCTF